LHAQFIVEKVIGKLFPVAIEIKAVDANTIAIPIGTDQAHLQISFGNFLDGSVGFQRHHPYWMKKLEVWIRKLRATTRLNRGGETGWRFQPDAAVILVSRHLNGDPMAEKPNATLPGTVEKIIKSPFPGEPERAEISVIGADDLHKEIRIENTLVDGNGEPVRLKVGAPVEVKVEAEASATTTEGV